MRVLLNNFTGGEVTPLIDARIDLQKYQSCSRRLENFRPSPYGGIRYRPGTVQVQSTKGDGVARLVNFSFSTAIQYKLEFGDHYIRFYRNKANLGPNYEIATPYSAADLKQLRFKQLNSQMRIAHPLYPPMVLSCFGDTNWTLAEIQWTYPPLLDQNLNLALTITPSAATGAINLVASAPLWNAGHVGSYWELAYKRDGGNVVLDISTFGGTVHSSPILVKGDWTITTAQYWYGTLQVERCIDGDPSNLALTNWEIIRQFVSKSSRNINGAGNELQSNWLRMTWLPLGNPLGVPPWVGTPPTTYIPAQVVLETAQVFVQGLVKVTAFTDSTHVAATVITGNELPSVTPCVYWSEGAWSNYRGFPTTVGMFEQRILYAGTTYKPNGVWGSASADFDNFQFTENDDSGLFFQIADAEQNPVVWMACMNRVHLGTSGEEMGMSSGNLEEAISPNNIVIRRESSYGGDNQECLRVDLGTFFVQRLGRRIREMREMSSYANPSDYQCPDLTIMAEHITDGGVTQMCFARLPDPQIQMVRGDGQLVVLTYNREQNVTAWGRYMTQGVFESVCTGYGDPSDEIWVIVRRTVNGVTRRFVEYFDVESDDPVNGLYLDCAAKRTVAPTNGITIPHLPMTSASMVVDGVLYENVVGDVNGNFFLPDAKLGSVWRVGFPYTGILLPMKLDQMEATGTTQSRVRDINEFMIRFRNSLGTSFGSTLAAMDEINWRQIPSNMDMTPTLYTGDVVLPWGGVNDYTADMYLRQDKPFPCTILALVGNVRVFG